MKRRVWRLMVPFGAIWAAPVLWGADSEPTTTSVETIAAGREESGLLGGRTEQAWRRLLSNSNWGARQDFYSELVASGIPDWAGPLVHADVAGDRSLRRMIALQVLGRHGTSNDRDVLPHLFRILAADPEVREHYQHQPLALDAIYRIAPRDSRLGPALIPLSELEDFRLREPALRALWYLGPDCDGVVDVFLRWVHRRAAEPSPHSWPAPPGAVMSRVIDGRALAFVNKLTPEHRHYAPKFLALLDELPEDYTANQAAYHGLARMDALDLLTDAHIVRFERLWRLGQPQPIEVVEKLGSRAAPLIPIIIDDLADGQPTYRHLKLIAAVGSPGATAVIPHLERGIELRDPSDKEIAKTLLAIDPANKMAASHLRAVLRREPINPEVRGALARAGIQKASQIGLLEQRLASRDLRSWERALAARELLTLNLAAQQRRRVLLQLFEILTVAEDDFATLQAATDGMRLMTSVDHEFEPAVRELVARRWQAQQLRQAEMRPPWQEVMRERWLLPLVETLVRVNSENPQTEALLEEIAAEGDTQLRYIVRGK